MNIKQIILNFKSLYSKEATKELLLTNAQNKKEDIELKLFNLPEKRVLAGLQIDKQLEQDIVDAKKRAAQKHIELVNDYATQEAYLQKELSLANLELNGVK